jgi:hypothetical protein
MAYRYNIDASGGAFTALTIDGACTSAKAERSLNKYTGVTTNNKWDEIITEAALDNDKLRLTASTNSSSSSRSGYGKIMYKINGNTCEAILHVVQEGGSPSPQSQVTIVIHNNSNSSVDVHGGYVANPLGLHFLINCTETIARNGSKTITEDLNERIQISEVGLYIYVGSSEQTFTISQSCLATYSYSRWCSTDTGYLTPGETLDIYLKNDVPT